MPETSTIRLHPDDVVLYKCDDLQDSSKLIGVAEDLSKVFPHNLVIVLNANEDLRTLNDQQLASLGLMRKPPRAT